MSITRAINFPAGAEHGGIYLIRNEINGKAYVGRTKNIRKRFQRHMGAYGGKHLYSAMRKYGSDNFTFHVLVACDDEHAMKSIETMLIADLGTLAPNGYNHVTIKGEGVTSAAYSPAVRAKLATARAGKKNSPESNEKRRAALAGRPRASDVVAKCVEARKCNGKKLSAEAVEENRKRAILQFATQESRDAHSARMSAFYATEEGQAVVGKQRGKLLSDETKKKISAKLSGRKQPQTQIDKRMASITQEKREQIGASVALANTGKKMYTDGVTNRRVFPGMEPEGFVLGFTGPSTKGMVQYTNGKTNRRFIPGTEPAGFMRGSAKTVGAI